MLWPFIHKTIPRRQIDPIECGATALGIILQSFGRNISNTELQRHANTSRSGSDAASLMRAATYFGLRSQAKRVSTADLKTIAKPAILFVDDSHFVVFEGYFLGHFYINDPAIGRYFLTNHEMRKRFSTIAIEFFIDKKMTDGKLFLQQFFPPRPTNSSSNFIKKILMSLLGLCAGLFSVMMVFSLSFLLSNDGDEDTSFILMTSVTLFILVILCFVFLFYAVRDQALRIARKEIGHLLMGLHRVPYSFFDDVPFYIFARIFADTINRSLVQSQDFFTFFIFSCGFLQWITQALIYWPVALLWLGSFVIFLWQLIFLQAQENKSTLFELAFNNSLDYAEDMRYMGQEKNLMDGIIKKQFDTLINQELFSSSKKKILFSPAIPLAIFLLFFFLITKNAWEKTALSSEELLSLLMISIQQAALILLLEKPRSSWIEASTLLEELKEARKKNIEERKDASTNMVIKFEKVSFKYRGEEKNIFEEINLLIPRGSITAVVAAPLLGTTTLLHLLAGKLAPSAGKAIFFVASHPFRHVIIDDEAEPFLGTLKDNLSLFSCHINEQKMVWALEQACATDLFYNRPLGLLSIILDAGKNLSIQEKKRLLLATALAHDPQLIVLDEFFEFVDDNTAKKIIDNLRALKITTIFSSYRINDLTKTDQILWIKSPRHIVVSHHNELLLHDSTYRSLIGDAPED